MLPKWTVVLLVLITVGCRPPKQKSDQVFWSPEKDTAWQQFLAEQEAGVVQTSSEGEKLFNTHCNQCHFPNADMTGPGLKGARERWIENSTEENFYAWIKNSQAVANSGDPYAQELKRKWNNLNMDPKNLSNEQIDEIFIYVESH